MTLELVDKAVDALHRYRMSPTPGLALAVLVVARKEFLEAAFGLTDPGGDVAYHELEDKLNEMTGWVEDNI